MPAIIAALIVILPGMIIANSVRPRGSGLISFLCESIVWSLLIDSAISWIPGGDAVPLWAWTAFLLLLACVGAVIGARRISSYRTAGNLWLFVPAAVVVAIYALVLLVRPNIDWDALTYYLPVSVQYAMSGHATATLYPYVSTVPDSPNIGPPILPQIYSSAIILAQWFHATADASIRLIALIFVFGIYASTLKLAKRYLPENTARFAALITLLLPAISSAVVAYPLYLDLGVTFLGTYFIGTLLEPDKRILHFVSIGAIAAAVALFKIDGFAFLGLALLSIMFVRLPARIAHFGSAILAISMVGVAFKLGFISGAYSPGLWTAVIFCAIIFVAISGRAPAPLRFSFGPILGLLLGFIPAIIQAVKMTRGIGSIAGYYVPAWVRNVPQSWHTALSKLSSSHLYTASLQPGNPAHFGVGLVLWWGFSPLVGVLAFGACVAAIVRRSQISEIVAIVASFDLAFLTIFRLDDLRHLLPVAPLMVILAIWGLRTIAKSRATTWMVTSVCLISITPFAWAAQEGVFGPPAQPLLNIKWDQWNALSTTGLMNAALLVILLLCCIYAIIRNRPRIEYFIPIMLGWIGQHRSELFYSCLGTGALLSSLILLFFGPQAAAMTFLATLLPALIWALPAHGKLQISAAITTTAFIAGAFFVPLWSVAGATGLSQQADAVRSSWYGGYNSLLVQAIQNPSVHRLLTYKSYGVTWSSMGRLQRIDLIDATDLAYYAKALASGSAPKLIRSLQIQASILPTAGSAEEPTFERVVQAIDGPEIALLANPLLGTQESTPEWTLSTFYSGTSALTKSSLSSLTPQGSSFIISDRSSFLPPAPQLTKGLQLFPLPSDWKGKPVQVRITWGLGDEPIGSPIQRSEFLVGTARTRLAIPITRLLALFGEAAKLHPIRIFEIRLQESAIKSTLDFRSQGLTLAFSDHNAKISGDAFLLHPRWSVVKSVSVSGHSGSQYLRLYPAPVSGSVDDPDSLSVSMQSSAICKDPQDASIRFRFVRYAHAAGSAHDFTISLKPNNNVAILPLSPLQPAVLESIEIESDHADCNIRETLAPEHLANKRSGGRTKLSVGPPLPIDDLRVQRFRP